MHFINTNSGRRLLFTVILAVSAFVSSSLIAQTFTVLHAFTNGADGNTPYGIKLYGDTLYGGTLNTTNAKVFSVKTDGTDFTVIHTFTGNEGSQLFGSPVVDGDTIYGTALRTTANAGGGTIFKVKTDGSNFAVLHTFSPLSGLTPSTNSDWHLPWAGLILSGGKLYGTTATGGTYGYGTVYSINTDGSGFAVVHHFIDGGIQDSSSKLAISGNRLFGATRYGGTGYRGTIFAVDTDGSNYTVLHNFTTSAQGYNPTAGVILSGTTLYGVTQIASGAYGTVYKIETDGSGFGVLHSFAGVPSSRSALTGLALSGDTLFGVTFGGGPTDKGTVYSVKTDGTGFTLLQTFSQTGNTGFNPYSEPSVIGNTLYGAANSGGGTGYYGTVFSLKLNDCEPGDLDIAVYVGLTVTGSEGCDYLIEYTTDLSPPVIWNALTTITLGSSPYLYIDTSPDAGNRFYRALPQ